MMNELIELAKKIKDKELRKKVMDFLNNPKLSNEHFKKYSMEKLERAGSIFMVPSSGLGPIERDIVHHTVSLTKICIQMAKAIEENYGLRLNLDTLIAASILHDLMKAYEYRRDVDGELEPTGIMLDHAILGVAELYARNFPEDVIHVVASHPGEAGTTPPRSFEALIFHHLDSMCSVFEYYLKGKQKIEEKLMRLTRKEIKSLGENSEESE